MSCRWISRVRVAWLACGRAGNPREVTQTGATDGRVLPATVLVALDDYERAGGGRGRDAARRLGPLGVVEHLVAAGLRGRGGAGFPTGRKWAMVQTYASSVVPATVVVDESAAQP